MPTTSMNRVIQHLLGACGWDGGRLTDGELLTRFLSNRDEAAIAALVRRHGPMVWGVCCRLLRNHHDAEDAFQATFLVLVTKASTLPDKATVGNWLYGVAHQTVVRMRAIAARRGERERQVTVMPEPATAAEYVWNDLLPVLDEELSRLPDKYRVLIILCDLEGVTRKEVARRLNIPEGTAASRLATARAMLAKRLARRGPVVSGVLLGAVLSQQSVWASVPTTMVTSTIKAATLVAAGHAAAGAISPTVAALKAGVTKAMLMTKIKTGVAVVLIVGLTLGGIGAGIGLSTNPAAMAQQPNLQPDGKKPDEKEKPKDHKDKLQGLWRPVSVEIDGVRIGEGRSEIKDDRLTIKDSSLTLSYTERSPLTKPEAKQAVADFNIDAKRTPKVIVLRWKKCPYNGKEDVTQKAIYAVEGDTLKLCLSRGEDEKALPTDFTAKADSNRVLSVFRRADK